MKGYKAQSELVLSQLEPLLAEFEERGESVIVEGVHLSLNLVVPLLERHPSVVPFLVTISNETKHRERFAVRAKYMSLSPETNRYVKYFRPIRTIQEYLLGRAARHSIPSLNNTNVDRSVDAIHACAFSFLCLEAQRAGGWAPGERAERLLAEYNRLVSLRGAWSSKSMLTVIRSRRAEVDAAAGGGAAAEVGAGRSPLSDDERTFGTEVGRTDTEPGSVVEEDEEEEAQGRRRFAPPPTCRGQLTTLAELELEDGRGTVR